MVTLVVDKGAHALVLAGDVYDGDWRDYATGRLFARQMDVLDQHGTRVFMVAGNHDAAGVVTKAVPPPGNVVATRRVPWWWTRPSTRRWSSPFGRQTCTDDVFSKHTVVNR